MQKRISDSKDNKENELNNCGDPPTVVYVDDEDDVFPAELRDFRKPRAFTLPPEIMATPPADVMKRDLTPPNNFLTPSYQTKLKGQ